MDKNYIDECLEDEDKELYRLASLVGTDAKNPKDNLKTFLKQKLQQIEKQSYQAGYSKGNKSGFKEGQERKVEEITEEIDEMSFVDKITKERIKRRLLS